MWNETPSFIPADQWPPNSPDCNPLDYYVWNALRERVYSGRSSNAFNSLEELGSAAKVAWEKIPQDDIDRAIDQFRTRLNAVAEEEGGPIAHKCTCV